MMNVQFFSPGAQFSGPDCQGARYFSHVTRDTVLEQMESQARKRKRHLFLATEEERSVAIGVTKVRKVISANDREVRLSGSHARHRSQAGRPLVAGHSYEVAIDPSSNAILRVEDPPDEPAVEEEETSRFSIHPEVDLLPLNLESARAFFSRMQRQPHIPFQYPANGCWARAHEMCRLIEHYLDSDPKDVVAKIWNIGSLVVKTENNPEGQVEWSHHVAPVVRVGAALLVIDPALFNGPVGIDEWRRVQTDPEARCLFTSWNAYDLRKNDLFVGATDDKTEQDLGEFRRDLVNQIYFKGPLPYSSTATPPSVDEGEHVVLHSQADARRKLLARGSLFVS